VEFLRIQDIPQGTLFLKDFGISEDKFFKSSHRRHKLAAIRRVLETYPDLPFLLIGDSGQRDPEIYRVVAAEYPDRIAAIYIRDVGLPAKRERVLELARETRRSGVDMILAEDTLVAAQHAAEQGWVGDATVAAVRAELAREARKLPNLADLAEEAGAAADEILTPEEERAERRARASNVEEAPEETPAEETDSQRVPGQ
jgi:phosphatidate phosphatase APP1